MYMVDRLPVILFELKVYTYRRGIDESTAEVVE